MPATEKVLWVVNYNDVDDFFAVAKAVGANSVAIRSDNNLKKAIAKFHPAAIKVYGWRWPSSQHDAAMNEADKIANLLRNEDLDGYFADPEGDPGKPWDWDRKGLESLAEDFSATIKQAAGTKRYGVTSHYRAKHTFAKLPWAEFFAHADVLLPQSYWRSTGGVIGHGIPADNYQRGIEAWTDAGGGSIPIVPMAGELGSSKAAEVREYAKAASDHGITELHYYTTEPSVTQAVWDAVKAT
jgi:hypothetical protein